jgi:hypothetical protein
MPIAAHELPKFETTPMLEHIIREAPAEYPAAERSSLFRSFCSFYDGKSTLPVLQMETAAMWFDFWSTHHGELDPLIPDEKPDESLHSLGGVRAAQENIVTALNTKFDSVFEMFGLSEYEETARRGTVARPVSLLLAPLYAFRPSVAELEELPAEHRLQVVALLQPGFGTAEAFAWVTRDRSNMRFKHTSEGARQRYGAMLANGVPPQEAIFLVMKFPMLPIWKLLAAYREGIPVDYIAEVL